MSVHCKQNIEATNIHSNKSSGHDSVYVANVISNQLKYLLRKITQFVLVESRAVCAAIQKLNYRAKTTAAMFTSKQRMDALEGSLTAFVLVRVFVYI